ncbi:MAG: TRZ/ATZ family hydrolase [Gammaproteobacteria bacterium]|nr:MAG: TRZ/ATZ family hydrolase [Gammaproteobacteria bacterium]
MQECEFIVCPGNIIYSNDLKILTNSACAVNDGKIVAIDKKDNINNKFFSKKIFNLPHHILSPGLINSHTHAAMNLLKGYADDIALSPWLKEHIWPTEAKFMNEKFVYDGTKLAIAEMIKDGITCFCDMYFYPNMVAKVAKEASMRAMIGMLVLDFPSKWAKNADEYISRGLQVQDTYKHDNLIKTMFAPHACYTVSDSAMEKIATISYELDLSVQIHLNETISEGELYQVKHKIKPLQKLEQLGLLNDNLIAVHMAHFDNEELELLQEYDVNIVHCPQSNAKLSSGYCDIHKLQQNNINVCIGTDGAASNNDLDILKEIQTAGFMAKLFNKNAKVMPAIDLYKMATVNAAYAYKLENTGFLDVGMAADMIAIDMNKIQTIPCYDKIGALIYSAGTQQITHNWVQGKLLMENRQLLTMDEDKIKENVIMWQNKINVK